MKNFESPIKNLLLLLFLTGASNCAVNPRCPTALLPVVEVQVNNSASTHDDYISTGAFTSCRARITNFNNFNGNPNFPGGVEVEFRNRRLSTDLIISPVNAGVTSSFFSTLPANGGWFSFFIKGNLLSAVDKSAILELATAGVTCNEVSLTRTGLMVGTPPIPSNRPQLEIEVGSISRLDDYLTWAPTTCRVKWINPPNNAATLGITLRNMPVGNRLRFANTQPAAGTTATNATTTLTLSGSGAWVNFYMAGNFNNASVNDKDAVLEILETSSSDLLAREGVMVRIRKNANSLTTGERDRYLEALRETHQTYNFYILFRNSHSQDGIADAQAHGGSAFLPWHRLFVLHLERLLQGSDPSIALPYWHFDQTASGLFNPDFLGAKSAGQWVTLSATNPISSWQIPGEIVGIRRRTDFANNGIPGVATELSTLGLSANYSGFKSMEGNPHGSAHNASASATSWIGGLPTAPQDPLFFFLHCNVDRLWAKWQWSNNRFDPLQNNTYDLQGSFTTPATPGFILGQYVDDTVWPWDNVTGGTALAQRPGYAPLTPFPIALGGLFPGSQPNIRSTIDYRIINFIYDDIFPF